MHLAFLGGGNMAEALIKGLLEKIDSDDAPTIAVGDPNPDRRAYLADTYGVTVYASNRDALDGAALIIVAVKPQALDEVLVAVQDDIGDRQVVVSIAAGVPIARIRSHLYADSRVIRVMPNTPALVAAGASAVAPGPEVSASDVEAVCTVFAAVGTVVVVPEDQMDAVTAVSGSGPAYAFTFIEALADGGVAMGLPRETALTLAAQTVLGAATMVRDTGTHPALLKDMVTSPGGTTAAALSVLEDRGVRGAVIAAVAAGAARSRELGG